MYLRENVQLRIDIQRGEIYVFCGETKIKFNLSKLASSVVDLPIPYQLNNVAHH